MTGVLAATPSSGIIVESRVSVDEDKSLDDDCSTLTDDVAITVSHLNLVDLAGSENASQTGATGDRLREGGFINKSLFMLGHVISQLSEGELFVNYRDSKLTRILQSSLGGNARTAIICTVTPATVDQTLSTLRFASRAKSIKNKPVVNEVLSEAAQLKRLSKEISQLKRALEEERTGKKKEDEVLEVKEKLEMEQQMNSNLKQKIEQLNEKLVTSSAYRTPKGLPGKWKTNKRRETWAAPAMMRRRTTNLPSTLATINADFRLSPLQSVAKPKSPLRTFKESESDSYSAMDDYNFTEITNSILKKMEYEPSDCSMISNDGSVSDMISCLKKTSKPGPSKVSFLVPSAEPDTDGSVFVPDSVCSGRSKRRRRRSLDAIPPLPQILGVSVECQTEVPALPNMTNSLPETTGVSVECQTDDSLVPKLK